MRGHEMNAYTAQLAGVAMVLDGLCRLPKDARSGWTLAAGLGVMLLATGLMEPLALSLLVLALPVISPTYRSDQAKKTLYLGLMAALGVALVWLAVLWFRHEPLIPALQLQRWPLWASPGYAFKPFYVAGLLPWYLWPTWPLAAWALYHSRRTWREPTTLVPSANSREVATNVPPSDRLSV